MLALVSKLDLTWKGRLQNGKAGRPGNFKEKSVFSALLTDFKVLCSIPNTDTRNTKGAT